MANEHFLNLVSLAGEPVESYALLSFRGREAISEPFDYVIEVLTDETPTLTGWIGKLAEFTLAPDSADVRSFAGRIYGAYGAWQDGRLRIEVHIGPAYLALSYARATHFIQDQTSLAIFDAMTADVPNLIKTVSVSPAPAPRGYVVRYDESEIDFLARLLAQDGIFYLFAYDRDGGGTYHHRMILSDKAADYVDLDASPVPYKPDARFGTITSLERHYRAGARSHAHTSVNQNKLDTPFTGTASSPLAWGTVYPHPDETNGYEGFAQANLDSRQTATDQNLAQGCDIISGSSGEHTLMAGGRLDIADAGSLVTGKIVLTSVTHMAHDPWMLHSAQAGSYTNSFTAIDATLIWRPRVGDPRRVAPGPVVGIIDNDGGATGAIEVDSQWRVPVSIIGAHVYANAALPKFVWLPVQQQWAHSTHGAQFIPRIGTRVIVDFLYGNPDLPFVSGTVYTPSQPYPFDPTKTPEQSGWRSVTEGNGAVTQEFHFDDKKGAEEVYLYTGRNYRRAIDQDELSTIKRDQTETVERDQTLTVQRDQSLTVQRNQTNTVQGKVKTDITQTQTVTVTQASKLESMQSIELVVGPCSIKLTMTGIEIKAPQIQISADATLDMKAGAMGTLKAPMLQVSADGIAMIKGGLVMIN